MKPIPSGLLPGPFTIDQARALGVTERMLRGSRVRAIMPGVYVAAAVGDDLLLRCHAARLNLPAAAVFSHQTAATLHGLPTPTPTNSPPTNGAPSPVHVTVPPSCNRPRPEGLVGHRAELRPADVVRCKGFAVTSIERTWCDLAAAGWTRDDLVVYADAFLRRSGTGGRDRLAARLQTWDGRRGGRVLAVALGLSSLRVDSPMETRLRLILLDAGLPVPVVNLPIRDEDHEVVHTPDLAWPQWKYAIDYDGVHHLEVDTDAEVLAGRRANWRRRHDLARQESLRDVGWTLRVVTAYELFHGRDRLVNTITKALAERSG